MNRYDEPHRAESDPSRSHERRDTPARIADRSYQSK
jgi:hypothetical protein